MTIPYLISSELVIDGVTFQLSVEGLPQHFARLFPVLPAGGEDQILADQGRLAAVVVAAALDGSARQFLQAFQAESLGRVSQALADLSHDVGVNQ